MKMEDFDPPDASNKCSDVKTRICFLSLWRLVAIIFALVTGLCIVLLCKVYIKFVLLWLEHQDPIVISITISVLFILVSLPISVGYIVLVVAEGYLFGVVRGMVLTVLGANFGLLVAHNLLKLVGHHKSIFKYTQNETAQAIMRVISGPLCFKIVFCSRLTPIPFGLQNTIFALSNVNTKIYHLASLLGLIPAQLVGVYVGTTLRSMQDVLEDRPISSTTYVFITLQLLLAVCLMVWLSAKARLELMKALAEAESTSTKAAAFSIV
ncbi:SNARE assoc domain containing protein [Asbolus verrucosus]|uniref:SNARE assoc domain containing protein n=1 Tax=Asbolus verrucosus TaxID=1661398 RepID=A0A482VLW8_ASBVE|nr:SNARE assoc domain containing protein [Asbolus verrucosus]